MPVKEPRGRYRTVRWRLGEIAAVGIERWGKDGRRRSDKRVLWSHEDELLVCSPSLAPEQSRARLLSPLPGLTAVCHGATTGAEQQRCVAPAGAGARCLLPCRARYICFHPVFFWSHLEPVWVEFGRNLLKLCTRARFANSLWLDFVVCRD